MVAFKLCGLNAAETEPMYKTTGSLIIILCIPKFGIEAGAEKKAAREAKKAMGSRVDGLAHRRVVARRRVVDTFVWQFLPIIFDKDVKLCEGKIERGRCFTTLEQCVPVFFKNKLSNFSATSLQISASITGALETFKNPLRIKCAATVFGGASDSRPIDSSPPRARNNFTTSA